MSDIMRPVKFEKLLNWTLAEYKNQQTIFGIPENKFFKSNKANFEIFGEKCVTPIGPAAGPHTQSTQNIVAAFLTGSRFFELKTVQILDKLEIEKPCIDATDEGYNTEWSTELTVQQAYEEYVKAWFLLHILNEIFGLSKKSKFVFNMSVGYDLKGIQSSKIDNFIENLKDASQNKFFQKCKKELKNVIRNGKIPQISNTNFAENILPKISNSITLSTMHGCPPEDQEAICKYLMHEKKMHTFVKLNPTLHGYEYVKSVFGQLGFENIKLKEESFTHDMQYVDAIQMLHNLQSFAKKCNVEFGVKLSNTLAVANEKGYLPADEMYMSGRALYPLTINLAKKLSTEFSGNLPISYSGGANYFNIKNILECGIQPITMATDLLKPGGYFRLKQIAETLKNSRQNNNSIDLEKLNLLANNALENTDYFKNITSEKSMKIDEKLEMLRCFIAPCKIGCPINQDIPEYIRLVGEKRFEEAFELIISKNPLPFITGYICDHNCTIKCVRNDYEEPILIREMKRIASENGYQKFMQNFQNTVVKNGVKIAVIGAGPAGLSSAYFLGKNGFDVTVFDKKKEIGGTVSNIIPEFRIPKFAVENDVNFIRNFAKFEMNCNENLNIKKLKLENFKYIILAIGTGKLRILNVETDQNKIIDAITFLKNFKKSIVNLGKNVIIIGGGNSAMDAARAAKKVNGVDNVYIVYRRTISEMPADKEELDFALQDGIKFKQLLNPISFKNGILKCQKMKLGKADESGRKRPIPIENEFEILAVNSVISAIGEVVDSEFLKNFGIKIDAKIKVNKFNETAVKDVFIGGDALRGAATVVKAIADAQKIANGIFKKERIAKINAKKIQFDYKKQLSEIENKKGVLQKIGAEKDEPNRCLECNVICNKCVEVCPNRANIQLYVDNFRDQNQILHLDYLCNECGNCATFCPYDGSPYKDKFTLFWDEKDFSESENNGFVFLEKDERIKFKMRLGRKSYILVFAKTGNLVKYVSNHKINCKQSITALSEFIWAVWKNYNYLILGE